MSNDLFNFNGGSDEIWVQDFTQDNAVEFHDKVINKFRESNASPLTIYINSDGGSVYALLAMMDTMDYIRAIAPPSFYFITVAFGIAASSGADLLAHGDVRVAMPKASILVHQSSGGTEGHIEDQTLQLKEQTRLNNFTAEIFVKNTGLKGGVKAFKRLAARDLYLNAEQARDLGIVDHVGPFRSEQVSVTRTVLMQAREKAPKADLDMFLDREEEEKVTPEKKTRSKKNGTISRNR